MDIAPGVLTTLPEDLQYFVEPALRYGRYQDPRSPGAGQGWLAVEVLVGGVILGLLLHADWARDRPARRVWQQVTAYLGLALLGAATVLASLVVEDREALMQMQTLGWPQLVGRLLLARAGRRVAEG